MLTLNKLRNNQKLQNVLEFLAKSYWMDILGVIIILIGSYFAGYFTETLWDVRHGATWQKWILFGVISTISSCFSLISDRLDGRMNKWANWLSLLQTLVAMWVDAMLFNKSAYITYPITFIVYMFAIHNWAKIGDNKTAKPLTGKKKYIVAVGAIIGASIFSGLTNYIGFQQFSALYWLTTAVFAMSLIANIYSALKLDTQWTYWLIYNGIQAIKNIYQLNTANFFKYIFYICNSLAGKAYWRVRRPDSDK